MVLDVEQRVCKPLLLALVVVGDRDALAPVDVVVDGGVQISIER